MAQLERPHSQKYADSSKTPQLDRPHSQRYPETSKAPQLERPHSQRNVDTFKAPSVIHTMEQLLRGEASKSKHSPTSSSPSSASSSSPSTPFFHRLRHHDQEEDHGQNQKKSVLSKVKEKAKKLRHSLSKKKHDDGNISCPSSAIYLESEAGVEEDAEYLGAPSNKLKKSKNAKNTPEILAWLSPSLYESEKAPAGYKETARQQQPRGNPVTPEKHVMSSNDKHVVEQDREKPLNRSVSKRTTQHAATRPTTPTTPTSPTTPAATPTTIAALSSPNKTSTTLSSPNKTSTTLSSPNKTSITLSSPKTSTTLSSPNNTSHPPSSPKPITTLSIPNKPRTPPSSPNKASTKTVAEKLKPVYVGGSDAANSITSKFEGLTVSKPTEQHHPASSSMVTPTKTNKTSVSVAAPRTPPAKVPYQSSSSSSMRISSSAPVTPAPSGKNTSPTGQIWDKGVSVKEYLMNKLEPGEDEKALSQVISEAMSPRRTPGDAGVMEKVREAVTSLLRNEEPTKYAETTTPRISSSQIPTSTNTPRASSQIPVSFDAQEVVQEENHGRILQAN